MLGRLRRALGGRGEHVVFSIALALLGLLGLWWIRLLADTVVWEDTANRAVIALRLERAAADPALRDDSTRVVPRAEATPFAIPLPEDPTLALDVHPAEIEHLDRQRERRRFMVVGEGMLLVTLVGVCIFMLYRLVTTASAVQREMSFFVGQMTHEMKTPLAGLRALLETMQRGRVSPEDLPEMVALGLEQIDREEHLVQTLLQAQRLRLVRGTLAPQPLALAVLLGKFREHRVHGATAEFAVDADPMAIARGDHDAVWTILENLADNAVKFGAKTVRLRTWVDPRHAFVACEDDGAGFSPDRAGDLFRPFRTAHGQDGGRHGTGLGLYLSRRLARAMGGDLDGSSPGPGQGARFVLTLPREAP